MSHARAMLRTLEAARVDLDTVVARYCDAFKASGLDPRTFALEARSNAPTVAVAVLDVIGSWPSSEPELAALQRCAR